MPHGFQKVTDEPTQITYEHQNGPTVVTIFKRDSRWVAKAKEMTEGFGFGTQKGLEELIGEFPNRELAEQGALTWMESNKKGLSGSGGSALDLGMGGDGGVDLSF
jgi:isocitrate lyase